MREYLNQLFDWINTAKFPPELFFVLLLVTAMTYIADIYHRQLLRKIVALAERDKRAEIYTLYVNCLDNYDSLPYQTQQLVDLVRMKIIYREECLRDLDVKLDSGINARTHTHNR